MFSRQLALTLRPSPSWIGTLIQDGFYKGHRTFTAESASEKLAKGKGDEGCR